MLRHRRRIFQLEGVGQNKGNGEKNGQNFANKRLLRLGIDKHWRASIIFSFASIFPIFLVLL